VNHPLKTFNHFFVSSELFNRSKYYLFNFYLSTIMADPRIRTLKIKTGVVKRIAKEKLTYEKEAETQKQRIHRLKAEGKDEYVLRKEEEVLQESLMMVPDCQRRLVKAYDELKGIIESEQDLKDTEDYHVALAVMQEAKEQLPKPGELVHMC